MKLVGHPITGLFDCCTSQFEVFSHFSQCLSLIAGASLSAYMREKINRVRWIQVSVTNHKCSIGILSIFNMVFRYLSLFLTALWYWVSPNIPLTVMVMPPCYVSIGSEIIGSFVDTVVGKNIVYKQEQSLYHQLYNRKNQQFLVRPIYLTPKLCLYMISNQIIK